MVVLMLNLLIINVNSMIANIVSKKSKLFETYFIFLSTISLIFVSGFRYKVGMDYPSYERGYRLIESVNLIDSKDPGFILIEKILYAINPNPQFLFLVTSIFINISIVLFLYKNSNLFGLGLYFYITTFSYYSTMNGMRQYIAISILLLGYSYLRNREFIKYLLFVVIASAVHRSALIMIPIYFLVNQNIFSFKNFHLIILAGLTYLFYDSVFNTLFKIFSNSQYSEYEDSLFIEGYGVNSLRVLVWLLPIIVVAYLVKKNLLKETSNIKLLFNLCFIGSLFMIIAYKHMFIARFCMYFEPFYWLLLPYICRIFDKKTNNIITFIIVICYLCYSTLLLLSGDSRILPFEFNFNIS